MLGGPETQARKSIWFEMKYIQIQVCHLCSHHKLGLVNKFERKMKWKKKKLRDWKGLSFRNASLELSILSMTLCIYWSFGVKECNKELHFWFSWWIWENISKLVIELTNLENRYGKTFFFVHLWYREMAFVKQWWKVSNTTSKEWSDHQT